MNIFGPQLKVCSYHLVIVMAMEDGNREAIWTVRVVDHIETPMMVTVRHDYIDVSQQRAVKNMEMKARRPTNSSHKTLQLSAQSRGNASDGPVKVCPIREGFIFVYSL